MHSIIFTRPSKWSQCNQWKSAEFHARQWQFMSP